MKAYGFGGIPAMLGQQAWEEAPGYVVRSSIARVMLGGPKQNRRKEKPEMEVRTGKNGIGTVMSRNGIIMHCRILKNRGHSSRKCPDKDSTNDGEETPAVVEPQATVEPARVRPH
ncbi:hypothetical protein LINPERHAP2_LOCUS38576 [Linum perenne]